MSIFTNINQPSCPEGWRNQILVQLRLPSQAFRSSGGLPDTGTLCLEYALQRAIGDQYVASDASGPLEDCRILLLVKDMNSSLSDIDDALKCMGLLDVATVSFLDHEEQFFRPVTACNAGPESAMVTSENRERTGTPKINLPQRKALLISWRDAEWPDSRGNDAPPPGE